MNEYAVLTIAQLRALSKATYSRAYVEGYYAPGDGGGGAYWLDAADTTSADNGGTVIVATDNGRWKLSTQDVVNLKQFGARFDGSTDDTPRIQAAFNSGIKRLEMPAGAALITSNLVLPGTHDFSLVGQGMSVSVLKFSGGGLTGTLSVFTIPHSLLLQGFTLASNRAGGTALTLTNGGTVLETNICIRDIEACGFRGIHDPNTYWTNGIDITGLRWIRIDNIKLWGRSGNITSKSSQLALRIAANPNAALLSTIVTGVWIGWWNQGVRLEGWIEGVYWTGSEIWDCDTCFTCDRTGSPTAGTVRIAESHFNSTGDNIVMKNVTTFGISNSEIYHGVGAPATPQNANIINLDNCKYAEITGNHISSAYPSKTSNGVYLSNCEMISVSGNILRSLTQNAVAIINTSSSISVSDNVIDGGGLTTNTGIYNATASFVRVGANVYKNVANKIVDATGTAWTDKPSIAGTTIASLVGGAPSEQFNIALPANLFWGKPASAFISRTANAADFPMICNYDFDSASSTATNVRVTVRALSGNLPSGAVRFSYRVDN